MPASDNYQTEYRQLDHRLVTAYISAWLAYIDNLPDGELATLDTTQLIAQQRPIAERAFQTGVLLGARSVTEDISRSAVYARPPRRQVNQALDQLDLILNRNLLRDIGDNPNLSNDKLRVKVRNAGRTFYALGPSLELNQVRNLGFLVEALANGIETYRIQAVLDQRTTAICRHLNGRIFSTGAGLDLLTRLLAGDPDDAKNIAPWPDASLTRRVPSLGREALDNRGLSAPPYQAYCRSIAVPLAGTLPLAAC